MITMKLMGEVHKSRYETLRDPTFKRCWALRTCNIELTVIFSCLYLGNCKRYLQLISSIDNYTMPLLILVIFV